MESKLLEVKNLSISFLQYARGLKKIKTTPIKNFSISLKKGEILSIVGASGSGKSLLAHAIMDILPQNSIVNGEIYYNGKKLNKKDIAKIRGSEISFIPQSVNYLDPLMKVKNQVKIGLNGSKEKKEKVQKNLFNKFDLKDETGELFPYQLSGGMLRRVLFATSIKPNIKLLIADEPTPGIHEEALNEVLKQLKKFADDGIGVILITHDIVAATKISDYITVFKDGVVVETSPSSFFSGNGEKLKKEYTRNLWNSLPQNNFLESE